MLKRKLYSTGLLVYCSLIITVSNIQESNTDVKKASYGDSLASDEPVFILPDLDQNPTAFRFVKSYIEKNSWGLSRIKKRSTPSFAAISSAFAKYDIPEDLKYMAIVESNLNTTLVCSNTGATGIWQLMPVTACELGLKIADDCDERLHVYKSSVAVAKYLKQLYTQFGDWLLVVAAYNSGPAKVTRAIQSSGSSDFWQLQNFLPVETRNHVKRYISVLYFFEMQNNIPPQVSA